jgi:hypothetical protein
MFKVIKPFCDGSTWHKTDPEISVCRPPLLVTSRITARFMSWLTQKSPHCDSCTVIQCCVFTSQAVHLQVQLVLVIVSGDGE